MAKAYQKDTVGETGVTASFHRVQEVRGVFTPDGLRLSVVMESYKDQTAYEAGKLPVETNTHEITNSTVLSALETTADGLVLSIAKFSGATKVTL